MVRRGGLCLALILCSAEALSAQTATPTPLRDSIDRVRLTVPTITDRGIVGWIENVDDKTLTLAREREAPLTVDRDKISRIERPDRKRSRGRQALFGTLIGMAAGYGVSKMVYDSCRESSFLCELDNYVHRLYSISAGGVSGGLIGAFAVPTQRWKTVSLDSLGALSQQ